MLQRIIWMHYLLIGISAILLVSGCDKEDIEYRMTVDLEYVNHTDSVINFEILENISSNDVSVIILEAKATSSTFSYEYEGVAKDLSPNTCCNDFLTNVYSQREMNGSTKNIVINDSICVTQVNEKSTEISNYEVETVSDRHFRYTYTFDSTDFENGMNCE